MFVVPLELCVKCYAIVFKSELLRLRHISYHITIVITNLEKKNSKFAACKKKVQKILAYIGSIHYLCCKKEEPACWRGKLEEKPGQAQAGYQSSQLRCKL